MPQHLKPKQRLHRHCTAPASQAPATQTPAPSDDSGNRRGEYGQVDVDVDVGVDEDVDRGKRLRNQ